MSVEEIIAAELRDPKQVLVMWNRPGGPPGNGYRAATPEEHAAAILAALDAAGWVCVPKEPTNDMKLAGIGEFWDAPVAKVYRAMISSRPKL